MAEQTKTEKLILDIAKKLASMDNWRYDDLLKAAIGFNSGVTQAHYLRRATQALRIGEEAGLKFCEIPSDETTVLIEEIEI